MARLSSTDKAELLQVAAAIDPRLDRTLIGHLAELAAQGCQAKDVKVGLHQWLRSMQPAKCTFSTLLMLQLCPVLPGFPAMRGCKVSGCISGASTACSANQSAHMTRLPGVHCFCVR